MQAVVGASGACFGMLGAIMVDFFKSPHTMKLRCTRLLWIFFATFQLIYGVAQVRRFQRLNELACIFFARFGGICRVFPAFF